MVLTTYYCMQVTNLSSLMYYHSVNNGLQGHHKVLQITFGEYVDVYVGTDNTSKRRTIPCIALYSCANYTHYWEFIFDAMNYIDEAQLEPIDLQAASSSQSNVQSFSEAPSSEFHHKTNDGSNVAKHKIHEINSDKN